MLDFFMGWRDALFRAIDRELLVSLAVALGMALVVIALIVWRRIPKPMAYFKTDEGKGALVGLIGAVPLLKAICIGLVVVLASLVFFLTPSTAHATPAKTEFFRGGTWFNDASMYMGIDYPRKISAQCVAGGYDDRSTSTMGLRMNVWQSGNQRFRVNGKYTHRSCAINPDRNTTDAVGIELEVKLWCKVGC